MIILSVVIVLVCIFLSFKGKGWLGERQVYRKLKWLPSNEYTVLNDIMLPTAYGTTQIDHIVVSVYGVFVIETKNYKGRISGGCDDETWIKNVYGNKYSMPNPIRQNKVHVAAVSHVLGDVDISCDVRSIIAFSGQADVVARWEDCDIVYFGQLRSKIRQYTQKQMSQQQVEKAVNALMAVNITDRKARREHTRNVQQTVAERRKMMVNGICPRCGGQIIMRHGPYGSFYGCSNYPKCKFIQKK